MTHLVAQAAPPGLDVVLRLTLETSDPTPLQTHWPALARTWPILAVKPTSERCFAACCSTLDVDLICLSFDAPLPFRLTPGLVRSARRRGVRFEVPYTSLLRGPFARRHAVANGKRLVHASGQRGGGKGLVVLTSRLGSTWEARRPREVIALGRAMGLGEEAARRGVEVEASAVIRRGMRRVEGWVPRGDPATNREGKGGVEGTTPWMRVEASRSE